MRRSLLSFFLYASLLQGADSQPVKVIEEFQEPFLFTYLSCQKKAVTTDGVARLQDIDSRGGAGVNVEMDLSGNADQLPALRLKVGPKNQAAALVLMLKDDKEGAGRWEFPLKDVRVGADDLFLGNPFFNPSAPFPPKAPGSEGVRLTTNGTTVMPGPTTKP